MKLYSHENPITSLQQKENLLYQEIAEKIYIKRMKAFNKDALDADFYIYANAFVRRKQMDKVDTAHYETGIKYLRQWLGDHLEFRDIDERLLQKFKEYLLTTTSLKSKRVKLVQNTAASYYDKFALIVHKAFLDKYLPEDFTLRVARISNADPYRKII